MKDCAECGKPVALRAVKIRVNRHQGIVHYIEHADGTPMHGGDWRCCQMKPYPKRDDEKAWHHLITKWDATQTSVNEVTK